MHNAAKRVKRNMKSQSKNAKCERAYKNYDAPVYHLIQSFLLSCSSGQSTASNTMEMCAHKNANSYGSFCLHCVHLLLFPPNDSLIGNTIFTFSFYFPLHSLCRNKRIIHPKLCSFAHMVRLQPGCSNKPFENSLENEANCAKVHVLKWNVIELQ